MTDPVLIEVLRGRFVESVHRGRLAVVDADGGVVRRIGCIEEPIFPRSAVKAMQALPLVETGTADALGFGARELALSTASHSGEPQHTELAASMLAAAGLDLSALACGPQWPTYHPASVALARKGLEPTALHNNCSGKHAGFLCVCCHEDIAVEGYVDLNHPFQQLVRDALEDVTGAGHNADNAAVDGCSIPTYAIPLQSLALGFARLATGNGLDRGRAAAAKRVLAAGMAEPQLVAGTDRACTRLMEAAPGRLYVKTGAEGVYIAALPEFGLGIALKCDDGAGRAAEAAIAQVLSSLFVEDGQLSFELAEMARPAVKSRVGAAVGMIRPAGALLTEGLDELGVSADAVSLNGQT